MAISNVNDPGPTIYANGLEAHYLGTNPNDGTGDQLRDSKEVSNSNYQLIVTQVRPGTGVEVRNSLGQLQVMLDGSNCTDATFGLSISGVVPGTYTNPILTVDAQGRITSATSTSGSGVIVGEPVGGDLSGTLPNPLVVGLQGRPITNTNPVPNDFLGWNGTSWIAQQLPTASAAILGTVRIDGAGNTVYTTLETDSLLSNLDTSIRNDSDAKYVNKFGDSFSGNLTSISGAKVTGLPNPTDPSDATNKTYVDGQISSAIAGVDAAPTGSVIMFAGLSAPSGWALCQGQSVPTTGIYADLFAIIGYTFGGAGANFNLPDCRGRSPIGVGLAANQSIGEDPLNANKSWTLGTNGGQQRKLLTTPEMPAHSHTINVTDAGHNHDIKAHTGADLPTNFALDDTGNTALSGVDGASLVASTLSGGPDPFIKTSATGITATATTEGGGALTNVVHPVFAMEYIIKL